MYKNALTYSAIEYVKQYNILGKDLAYSYKIKNLPKMHHSYSFPVHSAKIGESITYMYTQSCPTLQPQGL